MVVDIAVYVHSLLHNYRGISFTYLCRWLHFRHILYCKYT